MKPKKPVRTCFARVLACWLGVSLPVLAVSRPASDQQLSSAKISDQSSTEQLTHRDFRASQWGLDDTEWQRYQSLMQGIRGSLSPATLSPIEVLGIHARSREERHRYAERWATLMREDAERILAFQRAYDEAQQRLFADGRLIDVSALPVDSADQNTLTPVSWRDTDRLLFFTATTCSACDAIFERTVSQVDQLAGIDVYLMDVAVGDESRIREWAASRGIDPNWVDQHKLTLNIDAGALNRVSLHTGQRERGLPVVILRREDDFTVVPPSQF
jgi:integrating conjugative element protein (TIGR03759 family)